MICRCEAFPWPHAAELAELCREERREVSRHRTGFYFTQEEENRLNDPRHGQAAELNRERG